MTKNLYKILIVIVIILAIFFILFKVIKVQDELKKVIYKLDYKEQIDKYSEEYEVDQYWVYALIKNESKFDTNAVSNKGAVGLMQLMEPTAKELAGKNNVEFKKEELLEPETNIKLGTQYLAQLLKKYNGNYILAVTAYNAGIGNVDKWLEQKIINSDAINIENIPFKETNIYVRKIIRDCEIYKELY